MPRRAPLRTSSPSHPRLESGKGEWHSQWYLIHFSDATHLDDVRRFARAFMREQSQSGTLLAGRN